VAPTILAQDPPAGGVLASSGAVRVTFSEPVSGVDRASFQLSDANGRVMGATVTLDAAGRTATLAPVDGLTIATGYIATLTGLVHDQANNPLAPMRWDLATGNQVEFVAGTYTGYRFGATTANLAAIKRATLDTPSGATAREYRVMDGTGYLMIDTGIWQGYWVHGSPAGAMQDDLAAPIPPLPTCGYLDLPAARTSYANWGTAVLDTVFRLPSGYRPSDLVDTSQAGLNGGHQIRSIAVADLAALVTAAQADGVQLAVQSAYRSYASQVVTFNGWVAQVGYNQALRTSARPAHSEHQLGTAIDFRSKGGPSPWNVPDWATTPEGAWMAANAWRFGWVMSYPKQAEAITCYQYEPWHYRYVGRGTAAAIHDAGVTLRVWLWANGYGVR
jgi:D-alanyl-D-alanine carboxypeptidase